MLGFRGQEKRRRHGITGRKEGPQPAEFASIGPRRRQSDAACPAGRGCPADASLPVVASPARRVRCDRGEGFERNCSSALPAPRRPPGTSSIPDRRPSRSSRERNGAPGTSPGGGLGDTCHALRQHRRSRAGRGSGAPGNGHRVGEALRRRAGPLDRGLLDLTARAARVVAGGRGGWRSRVAGRHGGAGAADLVQSCQEARCPQARRRALHLLEQAAMAGSPLVNGHAQGSNPGRRPARRCGRGW